VTEEERQKFEKSWRKHYGCDFGEFFSDHLKYWAGADSAAAGRLSEAIAERALPIVELLEKHASELKAAFEEHLRGSSESLATRMAEIDRAPAPLIAVERRGAGIAETVNSAFARLGPEKREFLLVLQAHQVEALLNLQSLQGLLPTVTTSDEAWEEVYGSRKRRRAQHELGRAVAEVVNRFHCLGLRDRMRWPDVRIVLGFLEYSLPEAGGDIEKSYKAFIESGTLSARSLRPRSGEVFRRKARKISRRRRSST